MPRTVARYEPAMDVGLLVPYPDYWAHSGEVSVYPGLPCSFLLWKGACKAKVGGGWRSMCFHYEYCAPETLEDSF